MKRIYNGLLSLHTHGEADDILFLSSMEEPLADELKFLKNRKISVRYWITEKEINIEQGNEIIANICNGILEAEFEQYYSEYTGYLWTDEELNIGGHDLLEELKSNVGKWLLLEIDIHEFVDKE
jgi:hypothetical protein